MALQTWLDHEVFGVTIRTIGRIIVFGGIVLILIRKLFRKITKNRV